MDFCSHCGEPVENDARSCPHCGSDHETGWNPDAEYLSLDLPGVDDDDESLDGPHGNLSTDGNDLTATRLANVGPILGGALALTLSFGLLFAAGFPAYRWGILIPAGILLACLLYFRSSTRHH